MWTLTVLNSNKDRTTDRVITARIYKDFTHALTDALDGESDIHRTIDDVGMSVGNACKPDRIYPGGVRTDNGYWDDFHFCYSNGIIIVIGETVIEDERGR